MNWQHFLESKDFSMKNQKILIDLKKAVDNLSNKEMFIFII